MIEKLIKSPFRLRSFHFRKVLAVRMEFILITENYLTESAGLLTLIRCFPLRET
jgi:hypothetical protein